MNEYGTGGQYAEDPRDWPAAALFVATGIEAAAIELPPAFRVASMPAVTNQGKTPQCVAFSGATVKGQQDQLDQGRFFDFDEPKFFGQIGGTPTGAYISAALKRLREEGYPVEGAGDRLKHKIAAYYQVSPSEGAIKQALVAFGPLWCIGSWKSNWFGTQAGGVLPAPSGEHSGHATVLYGWDDDRGFRFRNSWGEGFGAGGDFFLPYPLLRAADGGYLWSAYKTVDVLTYLTKVTTQAVAVRATAGSGNARGTVVGSVKDGARLRVRPRVRGAKYPPAGNEWFPIVAINGRAVGERFPGRSVVYVKASAVKGD